MTEDAAADVVRVRNVVEPLKEAPALDWCWEHGREWNPGFERLVVEGGRRTELFVAESAPEHVHRRVEEFARDRWPTLGQCYLNALRFADETGAEYVEGYAMLGDGGRIPQSHAWNVLDGHVVDVTSAWTAAYGAEIAADHVEAAIELGQDDGWWGVVFNEVYHGLP